MENLARTKRELKKAGITQERVALEVRRLFPDRTCSKWMVNAVVNHRAKSAFVDVAINRLLMAVTNRPAPRGKRPSNASASAVSVFSTNPRAPIIAESQRMQDRAAVTRGIARRVRGA